MPGYWHTRMRRGLRTKNWHLYAASAARLCNLFMGNGLRTNAKIAQDNETAVKSQGLRRRTFRLDTLLNLARVDQLEVSGFRPTPSKARAASEQRKPIRPVKFS